MNPDARPSPRTSQRTTALSIVSIPGQDPGGGLDGWLAQGEATRPEILHLAVVDGASVRIEVPGASITPTGHEFTALVVNALRDAIGRDGVTDPGDSLLLANRAVGRVLARVPIFRAAFDLLRSPIRPLVAALRSLPDGLGDPMESAFRAELDIDALDARYLRLLLPACVVTLVALDTETGAVRFAHAGDTLLLRIHGDSVERVTEDQMGRFDAEAIAIAEALVAAGRHSSMIAAATDPTVRAQDLRNGLRHNYVDERGRPRRGEGCGVIDGLPQLATYVQRGEFELGRDGILALLSDGMAVPLAPPRTRSASAAGRATRWLDALVAGDAAALASRLEAIRSADAEATDYPRFKVRDDATAVLVRASA